MAKSPPNKALVWTAKAALFCCGCRIEVGLAGQVGVKSGYVCWRRGVVYSPLPLIGGVFVPPTAKTLGACFKIWWYHRPRNR